MNCPPPGYGSSDVGVKKSPMAMPVGSLEAMRQWSKKFPREGSVSANVLHKLLAEPINFGYKVMGGLASQVKNALFDDASLNGIELAIKEASEIQNELVVRHDSISTKDIYYQKIIKAGQLIYIECSGFEGQRGQENIFWNEFKEDIDPRNYKTPDSPWSFLGGLKYAAYFGAAILAIYAATDVVNAAAAFRHGNPNNKG